MSGRNTTRTSSVRSATGASEAQLTAAAEGAAAERKRILDIAGCDTGSTLSPVACQAISAGSSAGDFAKASIKAQAGGNRGTAYMMAHRGLQPRHAISSGNRGKDYVQAKQAGSRANIHDRIDTMRGSAPGLPKRD